MTLRVLYRIDMGRVGILVLSPNSLAFHQVCLHLIKYWLLVWSKLLLLCLDIGLEFLISPILLTWRGIIFCQMLFQHLRRWSCDFFFFEFVYIVEYVNGFSFFFIFVVNDGFHVFLDWVCKNFIEYFCIDIHKQDWSDILFFVGSLCGLGIGVIVVS